MKNLLNPGIYLVFAGNIQYNKPSVLIMDIPERVICKGLQDRNCYS